MALKKTPPLDHQIEVTVFGPGYGESILLHVGQNKWVIVDSCIEPNSKQPAALGYLKSIGVSPRESVVSVIATHWHDDHVRGMAQIVEECENAEFCISSAFQEGQFLRYIYSYSDLSFEGDTSGTEEFARVFRLLAGEYGHHVRKPKIAIENRRILNFGGKSTGHGVPVEVWALSPSDEAVRRFLENIGRELPSVRETKRRARACTPNHSSIVNLVKIGEFGMLFGADLENLGSEEIGWRRVVNGYDHHGFTSTIFKIPHHGSKNAHNDDVWNKLLSENPYALVTPWNRSSKLPTSEDIDRIRRFTSNGFISSLGGSSKTAVKRDRVVDKAIKEVTGGSLRRVMPDFGAVQLRSVGTEFDEWEVELGGKASPI